MLEADHLTLEGGVEGLVSAIISSSTDSNFFSSQRRLMILSLYMFIQTP